VRSQSARYTDWRKETLFIEAADAKQQKISAPQICTIDPVVLYSCPPCWLDKSPKDDKLN